MPTKKIVYYMRHFQAMHNIPPYNYSLPDPELSPLGQTQAKAAIDQIDQIPSIDLVVCSPLTRTLQTYSLVFHHRRTLPLIIHPDLQEVCTEPCDRGSPFAELQKKFSDLSEELDGFRSTFGDSEWLEKINPESIYSPKQVKERAKRFHQWLMDRSEQTIFVISHNLMLSELLVDTSKHEKIDLENGEIRRMEYQC